jgi:hypothetical protein
MTGSNHVENWKALNSGHICQKLQRAETVITNRLLGHKLDTNTSKIIMPLCNTVYENLTHLSRFWRRNFSVSPPPSFRRSEPSAHVNYREEPTTDFVSSTSRRVRAQHGAIPRDAKPCAETNTERSPRCLRGKDTTWRFHLNTTERGRAGHHAHILDGMRPKKRQDTVRLCSCDILRKICLPPYGRLRNMCAQRPCEGGGGSCRTRSRCQLEKIYHVFFQ